MFHFHLSMLTCLFCFLSFIPCSQRHFLCLQSHVITGDQGIFSYYHACPSAVQFFYVKHLEWSLWNMSFPCLKLFIHFPLVSEENLTSSPGPKQPCITCLALQPPDTPLSCSLTTLQPTWAAAFSWNIPALLHPEISMSGISLSMPQQRALVLILQVSVQILPN